MRPSLVKVFLPILILLAGTVGGCKQMGALAYLFSPENPTRSVDAEYKELANANVAVVVYVSQATQVDHPLARHGVASVIGAELRKNLTQIQSVDPRKVMKFQDETPNWEILPKADLARKLGAEFVLYVVLAEYSTVEPASINLYRGRISAQVSLYKANLGEKESRVWGKGDFNVLYPPNTAVGVMTSDDEDVAYQTQRILADEIAKKFYKHKAPI